MPRHIEQPARRHSAPAARKIWSRPSCSACSRTAMEPGTTSMRTPSSARCVPSRSESGSAAGSGTDSLSGRPCPGLVPQVTNGVRVSASMTTSVSNVASSSVRSSRQAATAASQSSPTGAYSRPRRYSNVVSSGAIMPARAPASIDMLQIVIRASIDRASTALPRYSMTWP